MSTIFFLGPSRRNLEPKAKKYIGEVLNESFLRPPIIHRPTMFWRCYIKVLWRILYTKITHVKNGNRKKCYGIAFLGITLQQSSSQVSTNFFCEAAGKLFMSGWLKKSCLYLKNSNVIWTRSHYRSTFNFRNCLHNLINDQPILSLEYF